MKLVKLTMLAATAAIAAMAFIGASSASATPPWIGVCKAAELLNCKSLVKHPLLGRIIALTGPSEFNAGIFITPHCAEGTGESNEIESQQEKELIGTLKSLTFTGCEGCTGVSVVTPQAAVLNMETETAGWRLKANGAKVKFTGCPLSQSCTYEGNLNLEVQMTATEAFVEPKGAAFSRVEPSTALCAATGKWETGKTVFDWELDNEPFPKGTRHLNVFPSLIGPNLIPEPPPQPWIGLCKTNELLNCSKANLAKHPLPGRLITLIGPGSFAAGFVTVECASGEGHSSSIESQQEEEFRSTLEELTFKGCKGCTSVAVEPELIALNMETETAGWRLKANNAKVAFSGCPLSQSCTYEGNLNLEVQMTATEAFVEPKGAAFSRVEPSTSLCASTGKWEKGKTVFDWELDNLTFPNGTRHQKVFPSLIGPNLIPTA